MVSPRWRRAGLITLGLILTQLTLLGISAFYQSTASAYEQRLFPPPGKLIDIGGYRLHLHCTGQATDGAPTVVLEGGLGAPGLMWALVQPGLAEHTRVCSYDRAGYGWSEPAPADFPRTARQLVEEFHDLLQQAGEMPPFLLVGHSFGGTLVRVYASAYPDDVSGLILVDARHEDFFERMPPAYLQTDEDNLRRARWLRFTTPLGLTRLAGMAGGLDAFESYLAPLPTEVERAAWARMIYNPQHWSTAVAEREAIEESYEQVRDTHLPETMPLIVLTAENGVEAWRAAASPDPAGDKAQATWMEMQQELVDLSQNGEWVVVKGSGHYIYFDQPTAIIDAVLSLSDD